MRQGGGGREASCVQLCINPNRRFPSPFLLWLVGECDAGVARQLIINLIIIIIMFIDLIDRVFGMKERDP